MPDETDLPGDETVRHALRKAVPAHGEDVRELTFRPPTGADIMKCGNPVTFDPFVEPARVGFDDAKMAAMMATLAAVPPSAIGKLDPRDFVSIAWKLSGFFLPAA